jgi:hypothetical protein
MGLYSRLHSRRSDNAVLDNRGRVQRKSAIYPLQTVTYLIVIGCQRSLVDSVVAEESGSRTHQGPTGGPFADLKSGRPTGDASLPRSRRVSERLQPYLWGVTTIK